MRSRGRPTLSDRRLVGVVVWCLIWSLGACASVVRPPSVHSRATTVYLVRDSWHSGIRLPIGPERYVEYGFGEWSWFAEQAESSRRFLGAMLWPTRGALARRELSAAQAGGFLLHPQDGRITPLVVEHRRAAELVRRLETAWFEDQGAFVHDPARRFDFRTAHWNYSMWRNCFDATGHWLRRLGCELEWATIRSGFRVAERCDGD